jgi:hypothetical protein
MAEIGCRALRRRSRHPLATITEVNLRSSLPRRSGLRVDPTLCRHLLQVGTLLGALVK